MNCPKCERSTVVKVTSTGPTRVKEKRGLFHLIIGIITWPFRFIWRVLFGKKRENFNKQMRWNCRYCSHIWDAE